MEKKCERKEKRGKNKLNKNIVREGLSKCKE